MRSGDPPIAPADEGCALRILHVSATLAPRMGGPTEAAISYVAGLSQAGVESELWSTSLDERGSWCPFRPPRVLDVELGTLGLRDGAPVRYFAANWPTRLARSDSMAEALRRGAAGFTLLHIHSLHLDTTVQAARAARAAGVPYVIRPHGTLDPYIRRQRAAGKAVYRALLEGSAMKHAAAFHFTTQEEAILAEPALPAGARTFVVPLALSPEAFTAAPDPDIALKRFPSLRERRVILFLGRVARKKAVDVLIDGFALLAQEIPDAMVVVAGNDDESITASLAAQARRLGLADRVLFVGRVDGAIKWSLFSVASMWILPSKSENFALAAVEAMARGVPVVLSSHVNLHTQVADAKAGIVIDVSAVDVANAIRCLLDNPAQGREMAARGAALARGRFTREAVARSLLVEYGPLLRGRDALG